MPFLRLRAVRSMVMGPSGVNLSVSILLPRISLMVMVTSDLTASEKAILTWLEAGFGYKETCGP